MTSTTNPTGPTTAHPGILHQYSGKHVAFEHAKPNSSPASPPATQNTLLFISGLGDGLLTVPYTIQIARTLSTNWSLTEVLISASYTGWGASSLSQDAAEMGECVAYFRRLRPGAKIVLMGHSTGCQDVMKYLTGDGSRPAVDGAILQTPSSDREALVDMLPRRVYDESVEVARRMLRAGDGEEMVPRRFGDFFGAPCTARRWLSLASPDRQGDDDYFSSDLADDRLRETFGHVPRCTPLCVLLSERDEFTPAFVDKSDLLERWVGFVEEGGAVVDRECSGVVSGATHSLIEDSPDVVEDLVLRVVRFVERCAPGARGEAS